jgi:hypothetical protein
MGKYLAMFRATMQGKLPPPHGSGAGFARTARLRDMLIPTGVGVKQPDVTAEQAEFLLEKFVDEALLQRSNAAERELQRIAKCLHLSDEQCAQLRSDPELLGRELNRQLDELVAVSKRIQLQHERYKKSFRTLFFLLHNKRIQWQNKSKFSGSVRGIIH